MKPRLRRCRFRLRLVHLNADFAALNAHLIQLPAPQKHAPRIEFCGDAARIHRLHRLPPVRCLESRALRRPHPGSFDRLVMSAREMQTLRRLPFQLRPKLVAFYVTIDLRIEIAVPTIGNAAAISSRAMIAIATIRHILCCRKNWNIAYESGCDQIGAATNARLWVAARRRRYFSRHGSCGDESSCSNSCQRFSGLSAVPPGLSM